MKYRGPGRAVNDSGNNKCVGNVCVHMINYEYGLENDPDPENLYTVKEIERQLRNNRIYINFGLTKYGHSDNGTEVKALGNIEKVTDLNRFSYSPNEFVNFADAKAEGHYAIFLVSHVLYGRINKNGTIIIMDDGCVAWESWDEFIYHAKKNPTLYGSEPAKFNKAFGFKKSGAGY